MLSSRYVWKPVGSPKSSGRRVEGKKTVPCCDAAEEEGIDVLGLVLLFRDIFVSILSCQLASSRRILFVAAELHT